MIVYLLMNRFTVINVILLFIQEDMVPVSAFHRCIDLHKSDLKLTLGYKSHIGVSLVKNKYQHCCTAAPPQHYLTVYFGKAVQFWIQTLHVCLVLSCQNVPLPLSLFVCCDTAAKVCWASSVPGHILILMVRVSVHVKILLILAEMIASMKDKSAALWYIAECSVGTS